MRLKSEIDGSIVDVKISQNNEHLLKEQASKMEWITNFIIEQIEKAKEV